MAASTQLVVLVLVAHHHHHHHHHHNNNNNNNSSNNKKKMLMPTSFLHLLPNARNYYRIVLVGQITRRRHLWLPLPNPLQ